MCGSWLVDQPIGFVDHFTTAATGNSEPREVVNGIDVAALWADDLATVTTGASVPVHVLAVHDSNGEQFNSASLASVDHLVDDLLDGIGMTCAEQHAG